MDLLHIYIPPSQDKLKVPVMHKQLFFFSFLKKMYLFNDLFRITITFKIHYVDDLSPASWGFICLIFLMDDIYVLVLDFRQLLPWSRSFPWCSIAERSVAELSAPMLWCLNPNSLKVHSSIKTSRINCTRKRLYVLIERTIWRTLNVPPFEWGGKKPVVNETSTGLGLNSDNPRNNTLHGALLLFPASELKYQHVVTFRSEWPMAGPIDSVVFLRNKRLRLR